MRTKRSWKKEVASGLRICGLMIAGFLVFAQLLWGAGVAFSKLPGPKGPAWVALLVAVGIVVQTVERWKRVLPGLLILAAFNALVMALSGHLINNPRVVISREVSVGAALLFVAASVLSARFYDRRLGLVDRIAILSYVAFFTWGWLSNLFLTPLMLGTAVLGAAWLNYHFRRREALQHRPRLAQTSDRRAGADPGP